MNINDNILQQRLVLVDQAINQTYGNRTKIVLDYRLKKPLRDIIIIEYFTCTFDQLFADLALT